MWLALKYQKAPVPGMCSSVLGSPGKACARLAQVGARPAVSPRTWGGRSGRADLGDRLPPPTFCPCCRRPVLVALGCGEGPGLALAVEPDGHGGTIRAHGRAFRTPCLGVALTTRGTGRPGAPFPQLESGATEAPRVWCELGSQRCTRHPAMSPGPGTAASAPRSPAQRGDWGPETRLGRGGPGEAPGGDTA